MEHRRADERADVKPEPARSPAPLAAPPHVAQVVRMQRAAGNHAVGRMLQRMTALDVALEYLTHHDWKASKKTVRAKELEKEGMAPEEAKVKADEEVEAAEKSAKALAAGTMISLDDWVVMKKGTTESEYVKILGTFDDWKGDPTEKENFMSALPADKLYLFTGSVAKKLTFSSDPLDKQVAGSPNAARAQQANKELTTLQKKAPGNEQRLTDPIIALLVWGVAGRRKTGDLGQEGLIGIEHAVNAAEALLAMSMAAYVDTVLKLDLTGKFLATWDERLAESVLILKAVGARRSEYGTDEAKARKDVGGFAQEIRGQDLEKLSELTSTRDIGGGTGLQQKFTMSCGPTSIQIVRGESDPIYALDISKTAKHTLEHENTVGEEQEKLLGKAPAPRTLKPRWDSFLVALNGLTPPPGDVPKWQALLEWIAGGAPDPTELAGGKALANGLGFTNAELDGFQKYVVGLQTQPGLSVSDFQQRIQASQLSNVTNVSYPLKQFTATNKPKDKDLEEMWDILFRGRDILMGVFWASGGGHYMVLTDCRGDQKNPGGQREFLLSDPWKGDSQWLTGADLAAGKFGTAGTGYIDDIYY